jgi:hypothetical protein
MSNRNLYVISVPSLFLLFVVSLTSLALNPVVFQALLYVLGMILLMGSTVLYVISTIDVLAEFAEAWHKNV